MPASRFLHAFAQSVATLSLYREGHPARERTIDQAYQSLRTLLDTGGGGRFTFLGDEVVWVNEPLRQFDGWEWGRRLSDAGMQRIEYDADVTRDELAEFLEEVAGRLAGGAPATSEARQLRASAIRFGMVVLNPTQEPATAEALQRAAEYSLAEEAETLRWLHDEVQQTKRLHLVEAEAIVRSLSVAMYSERRMIVPLLRLRAFDEYTTTHALNVAVLTMALADYLGMGPRAIRNFGVAGLLHDIGKVAIPHEVLVKPGKLTPEERLIINSHTVEGARIILGSHEQLDMAAVVAYEHHVMIDGGGYPQMRFRRDCHYASRIVHVCDVYDALRTRRPYRDAWHADKVLAYIQEHTGTEFDTSIATVFVQMMRSLEGRIARLTEQGEFVGGERDGDDAGGGTDLAT